MTEEIALIVLGTAVGIHAWAQHQRIRRAEQRYDDLVSNLLQYGRPAKPTATVYDPGPVDDETKAQVEMRSRAIDRLVSYLSEEGGVSEHRAREEAERMISAFESRGIPE